MEIDKDSRDVYNHIFYKTINGKEIIIKVEVSWKYFKFIVFKCKNFSDKEIKNWFVKEIKNVIDADKTELIKKEKWLYYYSTKGVVKKFLK